MSPGSSRSWPLLLPLLLPLLSIRTIPFACSYLEGVGGAG